MKAMDYAKALYGALRGSSEKEVHAGVKRFAALMAKQGHARLLPKVLAALPAAAKAIDRDRVVTVESAHELPEKTVLAAVKAVGMDPDEAIIETRVRPELVGGVKVRTAAGTLDASVKGKLERLKAALERAA